MGKSGYFSLKFQGDRKRFAIASLLCVMFFLSACHHATEEKSYTTVARPLPAFKAADKLPEIKVERSIKGDRPLVVIDAGHGADDHGAKRHASSEKKLALTTALLLKHQLSERGYRVLLTRNRDIFIPLERRAVIANESKCALFVSIHYNTAPKEEAHGVEVYFYGRGQQERQMRSKKLAENVIGGMIKVAGVHSRGVKQGNFCVIRETKMPAILVEGGFMSNPSELKKLKDSRYLEKLAEGMAIGIDQFLKTSPR